jgi:hypothetical protein
LIQQTGHWESRGKSLQVTSHAVWLKHSDQNFSQHLINHYPLDDHPFFLQMVKLKVNLKRQIQAMWQTTESLLPVFMEQRHLLDEWSGGAIIL